MPGYRLIFMGAPGTGKGTQAQRLAAREGLAALSSGDVLRSEIKLGTPIGHKAEQYVSSGLLVPDEVVIGIMLAALARASSTAPGWVLDGFPRTVPQAEALMRGLHQQQLDLDGVLDFRLEDAEIIRRISSRRVCSKCQATYNTRLLRPRREGVCDRCGGEVSQRADDREEVIATRLATYRSQTAPLIGYFSARGMLHVVDAAPPAEQVEAAVTAILGALTRGS
ncbi:adenylate kinase [Phycisphaerae bacterium RAS1]|nr:adenylate kinase [Phycisphaerae bacterium RAS1]